METAIRLFIVGIISVVIYIYAGYPLVLLLVSVFRKRRRAIRHEETPSVALIISAYNEHRIIREKIENSLQLDYPKDKLRIIVASDGSDDGTNGIVREFENQGVVLKAFETRRGKSSTLNRAVLGIDEDIIIFSDANAFYERDAVSKLIRNFESENVGCAVGRLIYLSNSSYVGRGESLYWKYESLLNSLESKLGSVLVATGTIFAMRRELFRPVMQDVANDFQLPAEIAAQGYDVVYESEAIAYERSTYFFKEEFSRKRRIIVRGLTGFRRLRSSFGGGLRVFQFVSRKLLRWWIGPMLPVLYVANIYVLENPTFLGLFVLQNLFYTLALIGALLRRGKIKSRLFLVPFYFVMVNAAAFAAIVTYFCGIRLSSWEKAETTREVEEHPFVAAPLQVIEGKKKLTYGAEGKGLENLERIT